ncbi:MAG TPA: bifunctional DNA-formamidopyrimidine glycosylase/DNA-(apurinic or apyrimidinic site) lyase [Pyrinomonadaceae bacterium]|jgi:formamidopyrimidine-DNA glycosylase
MPELPEVEHVVRALRLAIVGRKILAAELKLKRTAPELSARVFNRRLSGSTISAVERRGKHILIQLDSGEVLIVHLRMTGKFVSLATEDSLLPHSHVILYLDDDRRLVYCDMRQFGRMNLVASKRLFKSRELRDLAPEPLSEEFSEDYLAATLKRSKRTLKQVLLDQTKVLGLGNIYAAEALFLARISPFSIASSISRQRVRRLHEAIKQVLREAIDSGSTLKINLSDRNGSYFGSDERFWRVYEREGEPCVNCGTRIRRVVHGGRSTYYCPKCQR